MGKKQENLERVITEIKLAAKLYKENLVGKKFLYVFDGRYIEVIYKAQNFRHLTGVESKLIAKRFYDNAVKNTLQSNQVFFTRNHPYSLCVKKIKHIKEISTLASSENFMLEEIVTKSRTYKFGTTDLNFSLCMNKETDQEGNEIGECYIVESLRDEDCFSKSKEAFVVTHIFSMPNDGEKYDALLYMDDSSSMSDLPENVKKMLSADLLQIEE